MKHETQLELLDTTLRDGEQTPGVAFTPQEKLEIARLLLVHLHLDRLEIGSARVSDGEAGSASELLKWAEHRGYLPQMEILGFIDNGRSCQWVRDRGGTVINFLAKGSERHCREQLHKTPQRHWDDVCRELENALAAGLRVNVYLEDWSNGMRSSFPYVCEFVTRLRAFPIERIMLPDTLGILTPEEVTRYLDWMDSLCPEGRFDFHAHNDYGLATANSLAAVQAGISGLHVTVNGLGERAGNQSLSQIVAAVSDHTARRTRVPEKELQHAADTVQSISGKRCAWNTPIIGSDVYTQTCGVHADGDKKGELYVNGLRPERFGRQRDYALGKLSGKASIDQNIGLLGLDPSMDPELRQKVLEEVIRLGDKKKAVTPADLPFIIAGVRRTPMESRLQVRDVEFTSRLHGTPRAKVTLFCDGEVVESSSTGDGGYDAFVRALRKCLRHFHLTMPRLTDYQVRIPPGGRTDALVEATITWSHAGRTFVTAGVDSDQLVAAVRATEKMLNLMERA